MEQTILVRAELATRDRGSRVLAGLAPIAGRRRRAVASDTAGRKPEFLADRRATRPNGAITAYPVATLSLAIREAVQAVLSTLDMEREARTSPLPQLSQSGAGTMAARRSTLGAPRAAA